MGTARARVAGSGLSCPTCSERVSKPSVGAVASCAPLSAFAAGSGAATWSTVSMSVAASALGATCAISTDSATAMPPVSGAASAALSSLFCLEEKRRLNTLVCPPLSDQKWAQDGLHLVPIFQECVVAIQRLHLDIAGASARRHDALRQRTDVCRWKEPVATDAHCQHLRLYSRERVGFGSAPVRGVVAVHRARQVKICIRIEAAHQLIGLMVQVRFDIQAWPEGWPRARLGGGAPAEALRQSSRAGVGEQSEHASDAQPRRRTLSRCVASILPRWIAQNRLPSDVIYRQPLCGELR